MNVVRFPRASEFDRRIDEALPPETIDEVQAYEDLRLALIWMLGAIVAAADRAGPGFGLPEAERDLFVTVGMDASDAFARLIAAGADERIFEFLRADAS